MSNSEQPRVLNVLIVDDDDADALMIEEALAGASTSLYRVADGRAALEFLRGDGGAPRPDLILLDLNMPRMGGLQTLEELKADEDLRAIPVVVLTTSEAHPDVQSSYRNHASAFVTKPMDLEAFESAVQRIRDFYGETAKLP